MINERLGNAEAGFSDMTIAAVAMLVNKEVRSPETSSYEGFLVD